MSKKVQFLKMAEVSVNALPSKDIDNIIQIIQQLANFPDSFPLQVYPIKNFKNHFIVKAAINYRIIFKYQNTEIIIVDIVHLDRIKMFYAFQEASQ